MSFLIIIALILLCFGAVSLCIAALGMHVLPDALSRQHAATIAATMSVIFFGIGIALMAGQWGWSMRIVLIIILMLITLPLASHLLARAAVAGRGMISHRHHPEVWHENKE